MLLLPAIFRKSYIYQVLHLTFSLDTSSIAKKILDYEFDWAVGHEFYYGLGIRNCKSAWSADKFDKKLMLLRKNQSSLEKNFIHQKIFFSSEWKSNNKKERLQDEGSEIKISYQRLP